MPSVLSDEQQEVLEGLMLGDGCLFKYRPTHKAYLAICRQTTDREYLEYHRMIFEPFIVQPVVDKSVFDNRTQKTYFSSILVTRHNDAMESTYKRWYKNGVKQVPNDIVLTPTIISTWFCDDGWIGFSSKSCKSLKLKISTHGFAHNDVIRLSEMLSDRYCAGFRVNKDGNASYIAAADGPTRLMLEEIQNYIPDSMSRKISVLNLL